MSTVWRSLLFLTFSRTREISYILALGCFYFPKGPISHSVLLSSHLSFNNVTHGKPPPKNDQSYYYVVQCSVLKVSKSSLSVFQIWVMMALTESTPECKKIYILSIQPNPTYKNIVDILLKKFQKLNLTLMVRFVGWYLLTFFSQKLTIFLQQEETRNYLRIKFTNDNDTHSY